MTGIETFFEGDFDHPRLRHWRDLTNTYGQPSVEVHRPSDGISFGPATLYVTFPSSPPRQETEPWLAELDWELLTSGWKAPDPTKEALRLALQLPRLFAPAENRVGDGYFNSAVVEIVRTTAFNEYPKIADLLNFISVPNPTSSTEYDFCMEVVHAGLRHVAHVLEKSLHYDRTDAEKILAETVANYLDERFSISAGKALGFYRH